MWKQIWVLRSVAAAWQMVKPGSRVVTVVCCAVLSACGGSDSTPITPSPGETLRYDGQWSGTTSQGKPITFTVASDQKVTAITVEYNFGGCSGLKTFSGLNLEIVYPPVRTTPLTPGPGFGYGSGSPEAPNYTQLAGWFTSSTMANGTVVFGGYPGCGNAVGIWTATRR
jgi:hypothetical protein